MFKCYKFKAILIYDSCVWALIKPNSVGHATYRTCTVYVHLKKKILRKLFLLFPKNYKHI